MRELETVFVAAREPAHCDAAVWSAPEGDLTALVPIARSSARLAPPDRFPVGNEPTPLRGSDGRMLLSQVPGIKRTSLSVALCDPGGEPAEKHLRLLLPFV